MSTTPCPQPPVHNPTAWHTHHRRKDSKAELEARLDAAEQRQLQLEERAQQLEAEAELGSPTPHAQAQASFYMQLSQLKEDVQQQMAAPPPEPLPKVELVVQEQKLVDLQMELVALQQELQQVRWVAGRA